MGIQSKPYAFVLMPFNKEFDDVYQLGIKAACDEVGIYCERVDETHVLGPIYDKIVNAITKADIIIADLSGRNPNVYYETGYAHALSKVTIHHCKDVKEIPFDLLGFQHIVYSGRIVDLKEKLKEKLQWASDYIQTKGTEIGTLSFDFFHKARKIEKEISSDIQTTYRGDGSVGQMRTSFVIDILNTGATESQTLGPVYAYTGPEVIVISSETDFRFSTMPAPAPSDDPEFCFRHKVNFREKFAATEWISLPITVSFREGLVVGDDNSISVPLKLRFLTESTPIDFPLTLKASVVPIEPQVDLVIGGEPFPESVETALMKEFSRDGSIEEAGFKLAMGVRNKSSQQQKVGPLHVYTGELVKKFDMSGLMLGLGLGRDTFESSDVDEFSRKFAKSDTSELDPFAYETIEFNFELDARKLPRDLFDVEIPILVRLFTQCGPVDHTFTVKVLP